MSAEVVQASRVIVGHCPFCRHPVVVLNEYGVWPYIVCQCGAAFDTQQIANRARYEPNGKVIDVYRPDVTA